MVLAGRILIAETKAGIPLLMWVGRIGDFATAFDAELRGRIRRGRPLLHYWDERVSIWQLCALEPGRYMLDGRELLRLEPSALPVQRRPRTRNVVNRSRNMLRPGGTDHRTPMPIPIPIVAAPRLTRPAA